MAVLGELTEAELENLNSIICSDDTLIANGPDLVDEIPPFSSNGGEVVFIARRQADWQDANGAVEANCPRNPGFDAAQSLGCFTCGQSSISFAGGNVIFT